LLHQRKTALTEGIRHGRVFAISPWRLVEYWKMTSRFDPAEYEFG